MANPKIHKQIILRHVCSEESPIIINCAYIQVSTDRILAKSPKNLLYSAAAELFFFVSFLPNIIYFFPTQQVLFPAGSFWPAIILHQ